MGSNVIKVDFAKKVVAGVAPPSDKIKKSLMKTMVEEGYRPAGDHSEKYDAEAGLWQLRIPCFSAITHRPIDMVFWYDGDKAHWAYATERGGEAIVAEAQKVG